MRIFSTLTNPPQATMHTETPHFNITALVAFVLLTLSCWDFVLADMVKVSVDAGRELAHDYNHGNCLACHSAPSDESAVTRANIAPPFLNMQSRFPNPQVLFDQIWDARKVNPKTVMPPFGANQILTEDQINKIIDYLYTL